MIHPCLKLAFWAIIACLSLPFCAHATDIQDIPSVQPGALKRNLEEQPRLPDREDKGFVSPAPPKVSAPQGSDKITFKLMGVVVEGSTVFSVQKLSELYKDMLGKQTTLAQVYDISAKITNLYQAEGYLLSFAVVPEQKVSSGYIKIQVVEGYIEDIVFGGDTKHMEAMIKHWKDTITSQKPVKSAKIEEISLIIGDLPGKTVTSLLESSPTKEGASILHFSVKQDFTQITTEFNNLGSRFLGPFQQQAGFTFNSLLGFNERLSLRQLTTVRPNELHYRSATLDLPITSSGTILTVSASRSEAKPGFTLKSSQVSSTSTTGYIAIRQPIIRSQKQNLNLITTFDIYNSELKTLNTIVTAEAIRSLRFKAEYDSPDRWGGSNFVSLETSFGLTMLGAKQNGSPNLSRAKGRGDYKKINLNLIHNQRINSKLSMLTSLTAQYAGGFQMLSSEEFGFGGRSFGRGYDSSEISGDNGIAGSVEFAYTAFAWEPLRKVFGTYQLYWFYDAGSVWKVDSSGLDDHKTAASSGVGIRTGVFSKAHLNIELAKPLTRPAATRSRKDQKDMQLLFSFKTQW